MADTLTLDQVVQHALTSGATVRLVGDDQQLAAVGAGGILRNLAQVHGALRLDQLHRFTDPAYAAATRGLRDGDIDALEFYLNHDRVRVGDHLSILDGLHNAWARDLAAGLDSLMLAPTREQVRDLNQHAQAARGIEPAGGPEVSGGVLLADDLTGHVGDTVITRTNDRRLAVSATDWVKNGDRWTITHLPAQGGLQVRHTRSGLRAHLPAEYVAASVQLGYATTIHAAQGVTADTVHGLTSSSQSRQELYTMLTGGRHANHVYVPAEATTGNPHDLTTPGALTPRTAHEVLTNILANDGAAVSATTQHTLAGDPARRHEQAAERYHDALRFACEDLIGSAALRLLEAHAERRVPGISDQPAWPTLRAHLLHAAAHGNNLTALLETAASLGRLDTASDPAAVIDWRLATLIPRGNNTEISIYDPIPRRLDGHSTWGPYLRARQAVATQSANASNPTAAHTSNPPNVPRKTAREHEQLLTPKSARARPRGPSR